MMLAIRMWVAISAGFFIAIGSHAADTSEAVQKDLADAKAEYAKAKKLAGEKLVAAIDAEMEAVGKSSTVKAEQRVKAIEIMEKEKELFDKSGWIPVSPALQKLSSAHIKALHAAAKPLEKAYERYLTLLLTAKDTDGAKKVLVEKANDIPKCMLIRIEWDNQTNWNFNLEQSTGAWDDHWRFVKGEIIIYKAPATPQGKATVENVITVSPDGQTFTMIRPDRTYTGKRIEPPTK